MTSRFFRLFFFGLALLATSFSAHGARGGPDDFGYSFVDSFEEDGPFFDFEDISQTGDQLDVGLDFVSDAIDIGFAFQYYGTDYTQVYISSHGYITFLADQPSQWFSDGFPTSGGPDGIVAAWWSDLDVPSGGSVQTQTLGEAPNRRFIIQYTDTQFYFYEDQSARYQFKLFEGSNVIEVHSERLGPAGGVTAGIENETGTVGLMYADDTEIETPSAVRYSFVSGDPVCTNARASVEELWPPRHNLVPVEIVGVTDPTDDLLLITITSIFQDEPLNTLGDGNTEPDAYGVGSSVAELRAERSGTKQVPGDGRVYHINFTANDGQGQCSGTVTVSVPHDQGFGTVVIDGGPLYDSTQ